MEVTTAYRTEKSKTIFTISDTQSVALD
ncbi:hypothetical protein Bhyg_02779 [Pseudolycoriella hygida]|uniref:Uncharacterized protein n=1 Tax=Pseudolycoriella hygida TaxID=35572 RepID=A0A9Q0ND90_9DIPT|nr:hypothetical protein Bhyg_02779 [Pseudolycoriella hygida]